MKFYRQVLNKVLRLRPDEEDYIRRYETFLGELPNSSPHTLMWLLFEDSIEWKYNEVS